MKRFACFCSVTFTVVGLLLASTAVAAEKTAVDPSGTWRWEHDEGGETVKNVLKLNSDGKKVTGTYQGRRGPYEITDGNVDKDQLKFGFKVEYEGQIIEISFVGKIKADTVDGTVTMKSDRGARLSLDGRTRFENGRHCRDMEAVYQIAGWQRGDPPTGNCHLPMTRKSSKGNTPAMPPNWTFLISKSRTTSCSSKSAVILVEAH